MGWALNTKLVGRFLEVWQVRKEPSGKGLKVRAGSSSSGRRRSGRSWAAEIRAGYADPLRAAVKASWSQV